MKITRYITLTALAVVLSLQAASVAAKNIPAPRLYMFGFAASFNDTIVHFTEIQHLDSAWIDHKTEFLGGRDNYSYQLRDFLAAKLQMPHRTCVVFYNKDRLKLEKVYLKMKRIYTTGTKKEKKAKKKQKQDTAAMQPRRYDIREIPLSDFRFRPIDMSVTIDE